MVPSRRAITEVRGMSDRNLFCLIKTDHFLVRRFVLSVRYFQVHSRKMRREGILQKVVELVTKKRLGKKKKMYRLWEYMQIKGVWIDTGYLTIRSKPDLNFLVEVQVNIVKNSRKKIHW